MAVAIVTVAGRSYRLGCEEGEEQRLGELAQALDRKITAMRKNFGEIGDQRLIIMAALEISDEAADAKAKAEAVQAEIAGLRAEIEARQQRGDALDMTLALAFEEAASRLERLAKNLGREAEELDPP